MRRFIPITLIALCSAFLALRFAWRYPYGMNPDGIAYLDLADAWAEGRWHDAINGYWSVLLPLLLAPLRRVGMGITESFGIAGAAIAFTSVILVYLLGRAFRIHVIPLSILCVAIALKSAVSAIEVWTPDLLFAAVGLGVTLFAVRIQAESPVKSWFLFGVTCGLLVLAKPVGMYTGLVFLILVSFLKLGGSILRGNRDAYGRAGMSVAGWIIPFVAITAALSGKYGYLTSGSSGIYNLELTRPGSIGHPMHSYLYPPPFEAASNLWTDATMMEVKLPFPLLSADGLDLLITNINRNAERLWATHDSWIRVFLFCTVAACLVMYRNRQLVTPILILASMTVLQTLIYLPVLYETRYLRLSEYLLAILFLLVLDRLWYEARIVRIPIGVAGAVIAAFLIFPGTYTLVKSGHNPSDYVMRTIRNRNANALRLQGINHDLAIDTRQCTRVARFANDASFGIVSTISLINGWYMSGAINAQWTPEETRAELARHEIDCLFVSDVGVVPAELEPSLTLIAETNDDSLRVYHFSGNPTETP